MMGLILAIVFLDDEFTATDDADDADDDDEEEEER